MKATYVVHIAVFSALVLFYIKEADAIKCYVCKDCESSFNSSHLLNCTKTQEKCVKMILMSGEVDRMCGDKNRCAGRATNGRNKRSIEEEIEDCLPKRRTVRQLLGGGDSGGSSNSNKNKNNKNDKNKDQQKEEKKGAKDASVIHCCAEDGCNGSRGLATMSTSLILACSIILCMSSSFFSLLQNFQNGLPN